MSEVHARERRAAKRRDAETRAVAREDPFPSRASSYARGHLCVSRVCFARRTKKKERPLVVYLRVSKMNNVWSYTCTSADTQSFNTADAFYTHACAIQWSRWLKYGRLNMSVYTPRQFIAKYKGRTNINFSKFLPMNHSDGKYFLSTSLAVSLFKKKLHVYKWTNTTTILNVCILPAFLFQNL